MDEIDSYLTGRLAEQRRIASGTVPAWAVLNRVAHQTRAELVQLVEQLDRTPGLVPTRRIPCTSAERALIDRVLQEAPTPEALLTLQRNVLIPLELRSFEMPWRELRGDRIFVLALQAVDEHHSRRLEEP